MRDLKNKFIHKIIVNDKTVKIIFAYIKVIELKLYQIKEIYNEIIKKEKQKVLINYGKKETY